MPSAWIAHVKKFATEHKMKFGEALADKRCSASYKSLQTSTPNKGPMSFVPVDAAPKKKSVKRKTGSSKSSSKRTQSKKTKTNSKSKVTRGRGRGKKSVTKTQSAGGILGSDERTIKFYRNEDGLYIEYKGTGGSLSRKTTTQVRKISNLKFNNGGTIDTGNLGIASLTFDVIGKLDTLPTGMKIPTLIETITVNKVNKDNTFTLTPIRGESLETADKFRKIFERKNTVKIQ